MTLRHANFKERTLTIHLISAIRDHLLWGRIQEATQMLRDHFPGVVNAENEASSSSNSSAQPLSNSTMNSYPSYVFELSLDPDHLTLNLRIQSFIEAVRTRPLAPPPPATSYLTPHHALSLYNSPSSPPTPPPTGSTSLEDQKSVVLHLGKELSYIANQLPDPTDRAVYLRELDSIWALIAYPDPEGSAPPYVSKYLQYDRRLSLADQINSAILCAYRIHILFSLIHPSFYNHFNGSSADS